LTEQFALASKIVGAMNRSALLIDRAKAKKDAKTQARFETLNDSLAQMLDVVEGADAPPTAQAVARIRQLLGELP